MLTLSQVSKSYGGRTLFSDVSLQVNRSERIGLVGPNGAGKSTLFSLILKESAPDDGAVVLQKGSTIGFLPQESAPIGDETVLEVATAIMREDGLRPRQKRRFRPATTDSRHRHKAADNWLAQVPTPDRPGQIWQSDITYIETHEGWLYLAFTLDACSRRCIAHYCRDDMLATLTITTFERAVQRQRPLEGLIHHSDRGSQYAADAFQQCLRARGVTQSMSRKANPYDNALAESFVATLKTDCFGNSIPPTQAAAKLMIFDYIETFYNPRRRHSSLGYRSPLDFEKQLSPSNPNN